MSDLGIRQFKDSMIQQFNDFAAESGRLKAYVNSARPDLSGSLGTNE